MPIRDPSKAYVGFSHTSVLLKLSLRGTSNPVPKKNDPLYLLSNSTQTCNMTFDNIFFLANSNYPKNYPRWSNWQVTNGEPEIRCRKSWVGVAVAKDQVLLEEITVEGFDLRKSAVIAGTATNNRAHKRCL